MTPAKKGTAWKDDARQAMVGTTEGPGTQPAGIVVALCGGHRCTALTKACGDADLAGAIAQSRGGVLISASCLQQCAEGAVAAVAIRSSNADITGPSIWLGGINNNGHLHTLGRWVQHWQPATGQASALPEDLSSAVIGSGPPIRLTQPHPQHR